jgi:FAD/FMN-containing dehydrogenase
MDAASLRGQFSRAGLDGQIVDQSDASYDVHRKIWNGLADRHPALIVRAASDDDVRKTVRIAAERGLLLAVRCGGHSLPGLSTCDDGIVLDLSLMRGVAIDKNVRTAEVQGGALLGDLDAATTQVGLVTPAGVVSHTGVGGLTLGGGMGWLSRRYGLTIDNLLSVQIVTADGQLRVASAESEPELFWGLRGGGGNFGVVTKFTFKLHVLGPLTVGRWVYAAQDYTSVLPGFQALSAGAPRELTTNFSFARREIVVTACWSGPADKAAAVVAPFGALAQPQSGSFGLKPYVELQQRHDEAMAHGLRYYSKAGFLAKIDDAAIACMKGVVDAVPVTTADVYVLQLGGAIGDVGEDATAYSGRQANYYWIAGAAWANRDDDTRCMGWGRSTASKLTALSMQGNYVNEQAEFGRDVAYGAYGAAKYERLAKLKGRYDPANLFRLNQNIEPKS